MRYFIHLFFIVASLFAVISLDLSAHAQTKATVHCQIKDGKSNCTPTSMNTTQLQTLIKQKRALDKPIHKEMTALHLKFYLPLATFFTTLLVAPLALGIGRFGTTVCAAASLALVFGWQIIYSVAYPMGSEGLISPFWAAWIQNILFATLGFCVWVFLHRDAFPNPFTEIQERFFGRVAAPGSSLSKRH